MRNSFDHDEIERLHHTGLNQKQIAEKMGCCIPTVSTSLKKRGLSPHPRTQSNTSFFHTIDTEEKAYWLGFIVADGNVYRDCLAVKLGGVDRAHLEKLKTALRSAATIDLCKNKARPHLDYYRFRISSREIAADLARFGVVPAKGPNTYAPLDLLDSSLHRHFWRGAVDGDGWITFRLSSEGYTQSIIGLSGSGTLVRQFAAYCESLVPSRAEAGYSVVEKRRRSPSTGKLRSTFQVATGSKEGFIRIGDELYGDATVFLDRKRETFLASAAVLRGQSYNYGGRSITL